jgi:hypothetical protein
MESPVVNQKNGVKVNTQIKTLQAEKMLCKPGENQDYIIPGFDSENPTLPSTNEMTSDEPFDGKYVVRLIEGSGDPFHPRLFCKKCDPKDGYLVTTVFPKTWLQLNYVEDKKKMVFLAICFVILPHFIKTPFRRPIDKISYYSDGSRL